MPKYTYDTNVFIDYGDNLYFPDNFCMCAVVIQELTAGAKDGKELQQLDNARKKYEKEHRMIVPSSEDWYFAGKVLSLLSHQGIKNKQSIKKISKGEQQRILRDVLIARTARATNATVVTRNVSDFALIREFCKVNIIDSTDFFER